MSQRTCEQCGAWYSPVRRDQTACSVACGKRRHRDSRTQVCALDDCGKPVRAKGVCAYHYKVQFHPDWRTRWPEDPEKRRKALRRKTQVRRARLRDPEASEIDRDDIGDRDGWLCGLCDAPIDRALRWPNPQSASLDHVQPLSRGGRHVPANVQISHLVCNVAKGNRTMHGGGAS